jgi:hypothetical protein
VQRFKERVDRVLTLDFSEEPLAVDGGKKKAPASAPTIKATNRREG